MNFFLYTEYDVIEIFGCTNCLNTQIEIIADISLEPNTPYAFEVDIMRTDMDSSSEYAEIFIDGNSIGTCNPDGPENGCTYFPCTQINHNQNVPRLIVSSTTHKIQFRARYSSGVNVYKNCTSGGFTGPGIARVRLHKGN